MTRGHRRTPLRNEAWLGNQPHWDSHTDRPRRERPPGDQVRQTRERHRQDYSSNWSQNNSHQRRPRGQVSHQPTNRPTHNTRNQGYEGPNQTVSQVRRQEYIPTPHGERHDNNLLKTIRVTHNLIVAHHHLAIFETQEHPPTIQRKEEELMHLIKPAKPTDQTLLLLEGNAKNWAHTTSIILQNHYHTIIEEAKNELSHCLTSDFDKSYQIAKGWARKKFGKRLTAGTLNITKTILEEAKDLTPTTTGGDTQSPPPPPRTPSPPPLLPSPTTLFTPTGTMDEIQSRRTEMDNRPISFLQPLTEDIPGTTPTHNTTIQELLDQTPQTTAAADPLQEPWSTVSRTKKKKTPPRRIPESPTISTEQNPTTGRNPAPTPGPQRSPRVRQTRTPENTEQTTTSGTRGVHNQQHNLTRPNTTTNTVAPPRKPTYHPKDHKDAWRLRPSREILIFGDSNLNRIPLITDDRVQIESYSGMNLHWGAEVLNKMEENNTTKHLIISLGINNKDNKTAETSRKSLARVKKAAEDKFPNADIRIALVNYPNYLNRWQKGILDGLNNEMQKNLGPGETNWKTIPKLATGLFQTRHLEDTDIHWTSNTGQAMLKHWLCCLN